jgi:uncharacterized protein
MKEATMSQALQALYEGDGERARKFLRPDEELSVFEAAAFGRVDRLRELLATNPSAATGFSDDGFTPLHLAVFAGQEETAQVLIEHGADVNVCSTGPVAQVPPLGTAAFARSVQLARLLLDAGAAVNGQGKGGFTALHTAAQNGDADLVRELLDRGADPTLSTTAGKTPIDLATDDQIRAILRRDRHDGRGAPTH